MGRADLDAVMRSLAAFPTVMPSDRWVHATVPALAAELHAAGVGTEALRYLFSEVSTADHYRYQCLTSRVEARVHKALAAYDQAVG